MSVGTPQHQALYATCTGIADSFIGVAFGHIDVNDVVVYYANNTSPNGSIWVRSLSYGATCPGSIAFNRVSSRKIAGVATTGATTGTDIIICREGMHIINKTTGAAISAGDPLTLGGSAGKAKAYGTVGYGQVFAFARHPATTSATTVLGQVFPYRI
jgi:predicted RecA/RadA family phage recombinase